jgi:acetoin utilization deacetylase AcuC-like enzyme
MIRYDGGTFFPGKLGGPTAMGGEGALGKNLNLPFDPVWGKDYKTPGDDEYIYAFERLVRPVLEEFQPELCFISAGFDSVKGDPIGKFSVSNSGYQYMAKRIMDLTPNGKVIVALEGGYNVAKITEASEAVFQVLYDYGRK